MRAQDMGVTTRQSAYAKKYCKFCNTYHSNANVECMTCKIPFRLSEELDLTDKIVELSLSFLSQVMQKITYLQEPHIKKEFQVTDCSSVFQMKTKICEMLQTDELLIDHEYDQEIMIQAVDRIYKEFKTGKYDKGCLLYTSPSPRDRQKSRMPSSA
eukprot:TRINITY_DN8184_c0_g1_i1.p2 TRINITY_DN8184_c0_g1~~TRINITY_DN8184_c0_g1_i1.p2  ORF type:complete len:156 (-),score=27.22 TRINITY_DN8184_c0_g1_i1:48-515(-)